MVPSIPLVVFAILVPLLLTFAWLRRLWRFTLTRLYPSQINGMNSMLKLFVFLFACIASVSDLPAQMLIVDRGPASGSSQPLGLTKETNAFLADDFVAGVAKEDWVIDHIRLWAVPDPKASSAQGLGDLFKKISLFGGIAPDLPPAGQAAAAECDCHNLPALKTATVEPGSNSTDSHDVVISANKQEGSELWQIDFNDMKWSVPGGTSIQFGILAEPYSGSTWYNLGSPASESHLRVFSSAGKLQNPLHGDPPASMNIQVWGHLLARVSIHSAGKKFHVILRSQSYLDATQVDPASLHFGPGKASPESVRVEDVNHNGKADLVMYFRATDSGIPPKSVNACLTGKRLDGAPFEGCDLLAH